jgi:hypothetical protein
MLKFYFRTTELYASTKEVSPAAKKFTSLPKDYPREIFNIRIIKIQDMQK